LWSTSSQAVWALPSGGSAGALLVSPFNVKWRCYEQAGVVEESKFCLFSVVFPVRCISSVSPRLYFRRHAFCFLPLAAILEHSLSFLNTVMHIMFGKVRPHIKYYYSNRAEKFLSPNDVIAIATQ
jgi:hypothetical protein